MARIKIKELPVIPYDDIKDTDIMVVENKEDTHQASIADMKKVFSCDAKLSAITDSINKQLEELEKVINDNNSIITENIEQLENELGVAKNNINSILKRLNTAEDTIVSHGNRITTLEKETTTIKNRLDENDEMNERQNENLDSLNKDNETNQSNIKDLQDLTQEHSEHLSQIDQTLDDHKELIDSNKEETDKTAQENFDYLNDRLQRKYMELLSIIDFYHHLTHDNEGNVVLDDGETTIVIDIDG